MSTDTTVRFPGLFAALCVSALISLLVAVMASPLIISADVRAEALTDLQRTILLNSRVIEVDAL